MDQGPHGPLSGQRPLGGARAAFAPWADPAARPRVRFQGVTHRFGQLTAVDAVDLDVYAGEFFALLGPSGCGKTTLLRLLAGFETPTAGRILLDGEDIAALPPHRRPIHMMFQNYALFPHLDVARNIGFGLRSQGLPRAEISARVEEMLALVKLEGLGGRRISQLSGGQKQRVALARALAPRPRILLLDEPLAALDRKLREETQFELMSLQQALDLTFIIVTHDQDEAMVVADRLAVMQAGRIVQVGRPAEVYEAPVDRYVAGFLGDVNLFEGDVVASAVGATLRTAEGELPLAEAAPATGRAWLAIRPEKLVLRPGADGDPAQAGVRLHGHVADYGYLGDWTTYVVTLASGRTVKVAQANTARRTEQPLLCGDAVTLTFDPASAVLLRA